MTEQQVDAILGVSSADFGAKDLKEGERAKIWMENEQSRGGIIVYFDGQGGVSRAFAFPHNEIPP